MVDCKYFVQKANTDIEIIGKFSGDLDSNIVKYVAPNPPDYKASYNGSALPFHSKRQAYDNTVNIGSVKVNDKNEFKIRIMTPNTYYEDFTDQLSNPYILLSYMFKGRSNTLKIFLNLAIPRKQLFNYSMKEYDIEKKQEITSQDKLLMKFEMARIK